MGATMTMPADPAAILADGAPIESREARLVQGADGLTGARLSILGNPRLLVAAAATLMSAGITAVLLGWVGASKSTYVEEQVPYLISGGLLGLALAIVGGLLFFTHWISVGVKEARLHEAARRQDHAELVEALRALGRVPAPEGENDGNARGHEPGRPLRRAPRRT